MISERTPEETMEFCKFVCDFSAKHNIPSDLLLSWSYIEEMANAIGLAISHQYGSDLFMSFIKESTEYSKIALSEEEFSLYKGRFEKALKLGMENTRK